MLIGGQIRIHVGTRNKGLCKQQVCGRKRQAAGFWEEDLVEERNLGTQGCVSALARSADDTDGIGTKTARLSFIILGVAAWKWCVSEKRAFRGAIEPHDRSSPCLVPSLCKSA